MEEPKPIQCPKCGSTQIIANKKGFSGKKAVAGALLTGGIGLLAGTIGSNKIKIRCLNCNNEFSPGDHLKAAAAPKKTTPAEQGKGCMVFLGVAALIVLFYFMMK